MATAEAGMEEVGTEVRILLHVEKCSNFLKCYLEAVMAEEAMVGEAMGVSKLFIFFN